jgi:hypothetical protein
MRILSIATQLAKALLGDTRLPRSLVPWFDPGFPHSLLRGSRNNGCVSKTKYQDMRRKKRKCPLHDIQKASKVASNTVGAESTKIIK